VVLVADHAPRQMLAGNLPALEIEGVAVAVVGRHAKDADLTSVFEPAQLAIVRDVAPHQIAALGTPGRALRPQRTGPQSLDRPVSLYVIPEEGMDDNDVGVPGGDVRRRVNAKVARRAGDDARRDALFRLGHYAARARDRGAGRHGSNQCPARYWPALYLPALALPLARHDDSSPKSKLMAGGSDRQMLSRRPRRKELCPARSQHVVAALAGERPFASGGRVIDIEPVGLIVAGRRKIAIGPPIGRDRGLP